MNLVYEQIKYREIFLRLFIPLCGTHAPEKCFINEVIIFHEMVEFPDYEQL